MKLHKVIGTLFVLVIGVFIIGVLAIGNVSALGRSLLNGYTVEKITVEFRKLDPFVSYKGEYQILDSDGARAAGIPDVIIALAQQVIEYQNRMLQTAKAQNVKDIRKLDISLTEYPLLAEFYAMLQGYKPQDYKSQDYKLSGLVEPLAPDTHPCGTYSHPVPNYTPPRPHLGWHADAHSTLLSWGFHQTDGYACGGDPFVPCERDYTRERGYSGPYGYCSSPRFRDQGTRDAANHDIWIQYGEPNPEVFRYVGSWPYWDWALYVKWWHDTY